MSAAILPQATSQLHYEIVAEISAEEYQTRLAKGWRHFGHSLFQPRVRTVQHVNRSGSSSIAFVPTAVSAAPGTAIPMWRLPSEPRRLQTRNSNFTIAFTPSKPTAKVGRTTRQRRRRATSNRLSKTLYRHRSGATRSATNSSVSAMSICSPLRCRPFISFTDPERPRSLGTFNVMSIIG